MKKLAIILVLAALSVGSYSQLSLYSSAVDRSGFSGTQDTVWLYFCAARDTTFTIAYTQNNYSLDVYVHGVNLNSSTAYMLMASSPAINGDSLRTFDSFIPADSVLFTKNIAGYWNIHFSIEKTGGHKVALVIHHNSLTSGKIYIYCIKKRRL